ncbi:MAG: AEC family transporter, partial [Gammaproteobacteria bacterium]
MCPFFGSLMLEALLFAFNAIAPIFTVVIAGTGFRRLGWIDGHFVQQGSKLVFNVALPLLIFLNLIKLDLSVTFDPQQVGLAVLLVLLGFLALWWFSALHAPAPEQRGVWVQGSFRGNLGIVGIALCAQVYGEAGLAMGAMLLGAITLIYNILSVWVLQRSLSVESLPLSQTVRGVFSNPLILAILLGLPCAAAELQLPGWLDTAGHYFAQMTLPLALICVGASLSLDVIRRAGRLALTATLARLLVLPGIQLGLAAAFGLNGMALGTLFLMLASPTATA